MNNQPTLNFARRLRPQRFNDVIGQDLFVGMLQNALFLKKFFPVYLFSGQRGCGKTTTARIFAAALNCLQREALPLAEIPCLTCSSCLATKAGTHPDFIEIDAASNTGVDNVRSILESSTYLPVLGKYKIYLIDEAHMLSKAAFNAFLKMMEEPPQSVLFMLATTESYKIPETIRSRCFQLLFKPIPLATLSVYLRSIATEHGFSITDGALEILVEQTDGSARDALNLLEQLSMFEKEITEDTLTSFFGRLAHRDVMAVVEKVIMRNTADVITLMQGIKSGMRMPQQSWILFTSAFKAVLYAHYGIPSTHFDATWLEAQKIHSSSQHITDILATLWQEEELFLKTEYKTEFLEHTLVTLSLSSNKRNYEESPTVSREAERQLTRAPHKNNVPNFASHEAQPGTLQNKNMATPPPSHKSEIIEQRAEHSTPPQSPAAQQSTQLPDQQSWQAVLKSVDTLTDRLLVSLLNQARCMGYDETTKNLTVGLAHNTSFFKEKMNETMGLWLPLVTAQFSGLQSVEFVGMPAEAKPLAARPAQTANNQISQNPSQIRQTPAPMAQKRSNPDQEIRSNPDQWPQAHLLLASFPGKIEEIRNS